MAGTAYTRTVSNTESFEPDLCVVLLDSALPSDIVPAKILPNPDTHFTSGDFTAGIRSVMIGKFNDLIPRRWIGYSGDYISTATETADTDIAQFSRSLQSGDSGSANYLIINNQAVLLGTNYSHLLTGPHHQRTEFDAAISALGAFGHSVSVVDLSGFVT
jgi:hypothetical protein